MLLKLIDSISSTLIAHEANDDDNKDEKDDKKFIEKDVIVSKCASSKFMDLMISLVDIAPTHWNGFSNFFNIFYEYANMGYLQRNYLINKNVINILGDLYLGDRSPYNINNDTKYDKMGIMGYKYHSNNFDKIAITLSILFRSCHTINTSDLSPTSLSYKDPKSNDPNKELLHSLSDKDKKLVVYKNFYDKMIEASHRNKEVLESLINLIIHWSYKNKIFSKSIIAIITNGVNKSSQQQIITFLHIMHKFVLIDDDLNEFRMKELNNLLKNIQYQKR